MSLCELFSHTIYLMDIPNKMCSSDPYIHLLTHFCSLRAYCLPQVDFEWMLSTYRHKFLGKFFDRWKKMYYFLQYGSLSNLTALPLSSALLCGGGRFPYGRHHGLVHAYCQAGVSCPAWAWLGKMEGGPVSHATPLVAVLTPVCLCVSKGVRVMLALVFRHTLAV